jgi:glycosyltransferase involved in cell wall biosynthesis
VDLLLAARKRLGCRLVVVGDGSLAARVDAAARWDPDRIVRHEWVDPEALPGLICQMDALTLPSLDVLQQNVPGVHVPLREQFGRVLVEAMACGVPVVGSDLGGIPLVMGDAGLVCPPGDAAALADRIAELRDDPELRAGMRREGLRRVAELYDWDRVVAVMADEWATLTTSAPTRRDDGHSRQTNTKRPLRPIASSRSAAGQGRASG